RSIEERVDQIDDQYRMDPFNRDLFLSILKSTGRTAKTIRAMNRCRFLNAYIPEWRMVRNLPRIDHYHEFTVDEHMIRAVQVAEDLIIGEVDSTRAHVSKVAQQLLRVDLL